MDLNRLFILQFVMFAEMAAGYLVCKLKILKPTDRSVLSRLVVNVFLPCSIMNSFDIEVNAEILKNFLGILCVSAGIQLFCYILSRFAYQRLDKGRRAVLQYSTMCSNAGFLGNAVAHGVYGEMGLLYGQFYLIPVRIVMWTAGISCFAQKASPKEAVKTILTHPCIIAMEIGLAFMILQVPIPAALKSLLSGLGGCGTPCIMIFLGMIMAEIGFAGMFSKVNAVFSFIRLIFIPACVLLVCLPLHLDPVVTGLSVILAAMPAGSTTAVLAEQYHADEKFAANVVVLTTLLSIALLPVWVMFIAWLV